MRKENEHPEGAVVSAVRLTEDEPFASIEEMAAEFGRLLHLRKKVLRKTVEPDEEPGRAWALKHFDEFGPPVGRDMRTSSGRSKEGEELRNAGLEQLLAEEETRFQSRVARALGLGHLKNWKRFVRRYKLSRDEAEITLALLALRDVGEGEGRRRDVARSLLARLLAGRSQSAMRRFRDCLDRIEKGRLEPLVWYGDARIPFGPHNCLSLTEEAVEEILHGKAARRHRRAEKLRAVNVDLALRKAGLMIHAETRHQIETALAVLTRADELARWVAGTPADVRGAKLIFAGGPGTGKTATALALVRALGLKYKLVSYPDLMSCFVSESEANIHAMFQRATADGTVLVFDEADMVVTRRVEVHHSSDRHANSITNTMLTELERFPGLCILLTNLTSSLDPAVERRLLAKVHFPPPDAAMRAAIFRSHLGRAPLAPDVDIEQLAAKHDLTGGMILNVVRGALAETLCRCGGDRNSALVTQAILEEACARERAGYDAPRGTTPMGFNAA
jgi:hypothetical protein